MEDYYYAGGLPVVIRALAEKGLLHDGCGRPSNGRTIG